MALYESVYEEVIYTRGVTRRKSALNSNIWCCMRAFTEKRFVHAVVRGEAHGVARGVARLTPHVSVNEHLGGLCTKNPPFNNF